MYCNSRKSPPLILLICFLFIVASPAHSQKRTGNSPGVAPVIFLDSTKEQDGLIGPVRRVQTETAKLETNAGVISEAPRQLLEVTTYNLKGERVDNTSYPVAGPSGTEEYKYDDNGNIVEMTLKARDGSIISREVYTYEKDGVGNWTKMTTSLVLVEDGKLRYEPVEATYRTIAYFYDETVAKMLDARPASSNPKVPAAPASTKPRSDAIEPAGKNPGTDTAARVSSANPGVVSAPPRRLEERTTGTPEGSRVERRADANNSGSKSVEVPLVTNPAVSSSRPAPEPPAKETSEPASGHKAAFNFYKAGREQFSMGNVPAAIQAYQKALEIEPDFADVHLSLGHAYMRAQKGQEAIKAFKEATRINPELDEAYYGLGLEYFRAGKMKEAVQAFKKAVSVRPDMAKAHYGLALAYQDLGKQDLLLEEYRIVQKLDAQLAKKLADTFPEFNLPCNGRRCD